MIYGLCLYIKVIIVRVKPHVQLKYTKFIWKKKKRKKNIYD